MAECYYEPTPATDGATMNPVPGAVFQVFEIADTTFSTPLSLRVGAGNPTTTVTASESLATLPGVYVTSPNFEHIWVSGAFEWRRDSIDGAKAAIQDAKVAAQLAAENAASELSARIAAGEFQGEPGRDGSNVVPTAQAIATEISTEGTPANTALSATYAQSFPDAQSIVYDVLGNVQSVTENGITTTYTYNTDGTVATDTRTIDGATETRTYAYTNGNLTSITKAA